MSILVVGQSGQVARALAECSQPEMNLRCLGRPELDLTDASSIQKVVRRTSPGVVINAAAYTAVDKAESDEAAAFALNCEGPSVLAAECAALNIPLIHFSTDYVFDGRKSSPYTEDDQTAPLGVYGRSKLAGEKAILETHSGAVILRTAWVYSPFGSNFVKTMLRLAAERDELNIVADQIGCPTSALDIASATLDIVSQIRSGEGKPGIYNLCGTGETSWHGFAEAIFSEARALGGQWAKANPIPASAYPTPASRPANSRLDCTKLKSEYGLQLPHWRDSLTVCVERLIKEASLP